MTCRRHDEMNDECFACRISTVNFSAKATPTRRPEAVATVDRESRWDADMPAYRRLRANGLQPRSIDGAARLEAKASDQMEVEYGNLLTKPQIAQAKAGIEAAQEIADG